MATYGYYNDRKAAYSGSLSDECDDFTGNRFPSLLIIGQDRSSEQVIKNAASILPNGTTIRSVLESRGIDFDPLSNQFLLAGRNTPLKVKSAKIQLTRHWTSSTASITLAYDPGECGLSPGTIGGGIKDIRSLYTIENGRKAASPASQGCDFFMLHPELEVRIFAGYTDSGNFDPDNWKHGANNVPKWLDKTSPIFPVFWGSIDTISVQGSSGPLLVRINIRDKMKYFVDTHTVQEITTTDKVLDRPTIVANVVSQAFWKVADPGLGFPTSATTQPAPVDNTRASSRNASKTLDCNPEATTTVEEKTDKTVTPPPVNIVLNPFYRFANPPRCIEVRPKVRFGADANGQSISTAICNPETALGYTTTDVTKIEALLNSSTSTPISTAVKKFNKIYAGGIRTSGQSNNNPISGLIAAQLIGGKLSPNYVMTDTPAQQYASNAIAIAPLCPIYNVTTQKTITDTSQPNINALEGSGNVISVKLGDVLANIKVQPAEGAITANDYVLLNNALTGNLKVKDFLGGNQAIAGLAPDSPLSQDLIVKLLAYQPTDKTAAEEAAKKAAGQSAAVTDETPVRYVGPTGSSNIPSAVYNPPYGLQMGQLLADVGFASLDPLNSEHQATWFKNEATYPTLPLFFIYTARAAVPTGDGGLASFRVLDRPPIDVLRHLANTEVHPTELFVDQRTGHWMYVPRATAFRNDDPIHMYSYLVPQLTTSGGQPVLVPESVYQYKMEWSTIGLKTDFHITNQKALAGGQTSGVGLQAHILLDERGGIPNYAISPRNLFVYDETTGTNTSEEAFSTLMAIARVVAKDTKVGTVMIPGDPAVNIGESLRMFNTGLFSQDVYELSDTAQKGINDWDSRLHDVTCRLYKGGGKNSEVGAEANLIYPFVDTFGLGDFSDDNKDPYIKRADGALFRIECVTHHFVVNQRQGFITELLLGELY
jgi:hypothetical protein